MSDSKTINELIKQIAKKIKNLEKQDLSEGQARKFNQLVEYYNIILASKTKQEKLYNIVEFNSIYDDIDD